MNSEDIPEEILFINNFQYYLILTKILNNPTNSKPRKGYIVYFNYHIFIRLFCEIKNDSLKRYQI